MFISVSYTFAFIGLRRPVRPDFGCCLSDYLFVKTGQNYFRLGRGLCCYAFWKVVNNRVGKSQTQIQFIALGLCPIANANDIEFSFETWSTYQVPPGGPARGIWIARRR